MRSTVLTTHTHFKQFLLTYLALLVKLLTAGGVRLTRFHLYLRVRPGQPFTKWAQETHSEDPRSCCKRFTERPLKGLLTKPWEKPAARAPSNSPLSRASSAVSSSGGSRTFMFLQSFQVLPQPAVFMFYNYTLAKKMFPEISIILKLTEKTQVQMVSLVNSSEHLRKKTAQTLSENKPFTTPPPHQIYYVTQLMHL